MKSETIKIFCSNCQEWFASPLDLADEFASDVTVLEGDKIACRNCRQSVVCDCENTRIAVKDSLW